MAKRRKPDDVLRLKLNLTIHPEVRAWADEMSLRRRRSISQLFEDLIEAAYLQMKNPEPVQQPPQHPAPEPQTAPPQGYYPPQPNYYPVPQAPQQPQL